MISIDTVRYNLPIISIEYNYIPMSYLCSYGCGLKFTNKSNMYRHERNIHPSDIKSNANISVLAVKAPIKVNITQQVSVNDTRSDTQSSKLTELTEQVAKLTQVIAELTASKTSSIENQTNHITINHNTLIYNCFDQHTIDIFSRMSELYGDERAVSYSASLLKGINKNNKHCWIRNPELVNLKSLNQVIKYDANPQSKGFHILNKDKKEIIDIDGSMVDKILTNTVINANLKGQSHLANKASQAHEDEGDSEKMWEIWEHPSICNRRGETIHDYIEKFKKVVASKSHLIEIFTLID